jgi:hypothetical protein
MKTLHSPPRGLSGAQAVATGLSLGSVVAAQEPPGAPPPPAAPTTREQGKLTPERMVRANNPLSDMNALNVHDYWTPSIRSVPDDYSNTKDLRGVVVDGRQIIRATVPVTTAPLGGRS